jgi:hypothetical protein
MQEPKAMWFHHKLVITMRTHEATWLHLMLVFFNKAQRLFKNKSELLVYCMHPFTKVISSSILIISKKLKKNQLYCAHLQNE